jgi:hypothetical protein
MSTSAPAPEIDSSSDLPEVLKALGERSPVLLERAKIVGSWIWIVFPYKPGEEIRAILKGLGFRWNRQRSLDEGNSTWQHPCGRFSRRGSGDPRQKYGELSVRELMKEATR